MAYPTPFEGIYLATPSNFLPPDLLPALPRHSYLDLATNSVVQTVALAHPDVPVANLYQLARSIEACSLKGVDWLKLKTHPT